MTFRLSSQAATYFNAERQAEKLRIPISQSSNVSISGAGGLRFKFQLFQSDTLLPMARHNSDISSKRAVLPESNKIEMGSTN